MQQTQQPKSVDVREQDSDAAVAIYQSRLKGLVKANSTVVDELQRVRKAASLALGRMQTERAEFKSKLLIADQELKKTKEAHLKQIEALEKAIQDSQTQNAEMARQWKNGIRSLRERRENRKIKMKGEMNITPSSQEKQVQTPKIALDTSSANLQDEIPDVETELFAVLQEKEKQIRSLESEVKALRMSHREEPETSKGNLETQVGFQSQSQRSAEYEDAIKSLHVLIAETCILPRYVPEREMKKVVEQQVRGEKMIQLLDTLGQLLQSKDGPLHGQGEVSFGRTKERDKNVESNRAISELKESLADATLQAARLYEELQENANCKRCAIRDSAIRRCHHHLKLHS